MAICCKVVDVIVQWHQKFVIIFPLASQYKAIIQALAFANMDFIQNNILFADYTF